jgi:hypothetical protein
LRVSKSFFKALWYCCWSCIWIIIQNACSWNFPISASYKIVRWCCVNFLCLMVNLCNLFICFSCISKFQSSQRQSFHVRFLIYFLLLNLFFLLVVRFCVTLIAKYVLKFPTLFVLNLVKQKTSYFLFFNWIQVLKFHLVLFIFIYFVESSFSCRRKDQAQILSHSLCSC